MTLLQQIQSEAVDGSSDLGSLLRRCRVLAQRIGVEEFKVWVVSELEGYPSDEGLPDYRNVKTPLVLGTFMGHFNRRIENAQIPVTSVPVGIRDHLFTLKLQQGICTIAEMVREAKTVIRLPWPIEAVRLIGQGDIYDGYFLAQAIRNVSVASLHEVLDQVRNRILTFALELESLSPKAGEPVKSIEAKLKNDMRNIFNTVIKGDVHNLAQGSKEFVQETTINKDVRGDFDALKGALFRAGLTEDDIESLSLAISGDKSRGKEKMGAKVKGWFGDVLLKISSAGAATASDVAASVITGSLKAYFGIP